MEASNNANTIITRILELSRQDPEQLKELERFRRSLVVLFTDIQGSTAYYEKFGDVAGFAMVHECNSLLRKVVENHGGRVIKNIGDSIMATFDDAEEAVRAAMSMQRNLNRLNCTKKPEDQCRVRIGAHYGRGIVKSNDVFGDVVNVASRVQSLAAPEQILISDALSQGIADRGFSLASLGKFQLKGKTEKTELYEVRWDPTQPTPLALGQTLVSSGISPRHEFMIRHLLPGGKTEAPYPLFGEGLTIGRNEGDIKFPNDLTMASPHAHVFVHEGQPFVEDISGKGGIFIRLKGVFMLENADIIIMGSQLFRFESRPEILAAATATALNVPDVSRVLNQNSAEFIWLNDNAGQQRTFPLNGFEVRFGRITGDYTFPEDRLMSRAHARVYQRGEDYFLEDLRSLNGTFARIRGRMPVAPGVTVRIGREMFQIA